MLELIAAQDYQAESQGLLVLANDADVLAVDLSGVQVVELQFPKYTDGRAYSQAQLLLRRRGFTGIVRATGDVLVDELQQMQRCGFHQAVLRADQNLAHGQRLLTMFSGYYQADAQVDKPRFALEV
mgnify:FL=1